MSDEVVVDPQPTTRMASRIVVGVVGLVGVVLVVVMLWRQSEPTTEGLLKGDPDAAVLTIENDPGVEFDWRPLVDLANDGDHEVELLGVELDQSTTSAGRMDLQGAWVVGPGRKNPDMAGTTTEADFGVPLVPVPGAVIPAKATTDDYELVLRVKGEEAKAWSAVTGVTVTYRVDGAKHDAHWNHGFVMCSQRSLIDQDCSDVEG